MLSVGNLRQVGRVRSVVQLGHDEEMVPIHKMTETQNTELAEVTAFLSLYRKAIGLTMVHVDNKGIDDGMDGEVTCIGPKAKDADGFGKNRTEFHQEGIRVEE